MALSVTGCDPGKILVSDIVVYGGTSAGVIAAYAAAKEGKSVYLISNTERLGGLSSGGLGQTDIGNKQAVNGLSLDFYRRLGRHYGNLENWVFEPSAALGVFEDYIREGQIQVLYGQYLDKVQKQGTVLDAVVVRSFKDDALTKIFASEFIDCSYEGDLMAASGVSYVTGREDESVYNEKWNGSHLSVYHQFPDGVDPYKVEGDPSSGLLWGVSDQVMGPEGSGDDLIQAYNFRICLTTDPENMLPVEKPKDYDPARYELLRRLFKHQDYTSLGEYFIVSPMPNNKTDINNRGGFSTDMIGMNYGYPEGSWKEREKIIDEHLSYTMGLLWFWQNDESVPEVLQKEIRRYGLPKDEYPESDHFTRQLYVREARRMVGEYVATQADCEGKTHVPDGVGMAAYQMDSHNTQRVVVVKDGKAMVKNEGDVEISGGGPYDIAYRSITPKREECTNLLVPVCLSASHIAFGSIRMEPVFMELAQSAAKAASLAIDLNVPVQQVPVEEIQKMYLEDPLMDGSAPDVIVDDVDVTLPGGSAWKRVNGGGYGPSFFVLDPTAKQTSLDYDLKVLREGTYDLYAYYIKRDQSSRKVEVDVASSGNVNTFIMDADEYVVRGQTSSMWVPLTTLQLKEGESVRVSFTNRGEVTGQIVADAVMLVPRRN